MEKKREILEKINQLNSTHIVKKYLEKPEYFSIFKEYLNEPSNLNYRRLDNSFRAYFRKIKQIAYVKNLIRGFSIDFDKKIRRHDVVISLDAKSTNNEVSIVDITVGGDLNIDIEKQTELKGTLEDLIEDYNIVAAIKHLSKKQKTVITYTFVYQYNQKEIAKAMKISEQMVSYYKKSALNSMKESIINN